MIDDFMKESEKSFEEAKIQIDIIKQKWNDLLIQLQNDVNLQLSPQGVYDIKNNLRSDYNLINDHYIPHIHDITPKNIIYQEFWSFFINMDSRIDIAVKKGEQNYRNEIHQQKIETINAYGLFSKNLGINVAVLVLGMLSAVFGIKLL